MANHRPTQADRLAQLDALEALRPALDGDLLIDPVSQLLYSTDASIYQETPLGAVRPKTAEDCVQIVAFAAKHKISLIPRTAGTSLAGQCVGHGLVVDTSRYMTAVQEVNKTERWAWVEPGVILDDFNDVLAKDDLFFGPDTSTSNRCMIGGMIGNNSCGTHSILYGTTRDHVIELEAVLSDGTLTTFRGLTADELAEKRRGDGLEARIYNQVISAVEEHGALIEEKFPKREVKRRNTGYALDTLLEMQPFTADGPLFNLAPFLTGSEGTLALTTRAKVNLVDKPKKKLLVCAHFHSLDESMRATVHAVAHSPAAVELMDDRILDATADNIEQARNRFWVEGEPKAVLVIEFYDESDERLKERADTLIASLKEAGMGYAFPIVRPPDLGRVWALRKAGLGLLMGIRGDDKAVTVIEDTAVAVEDLPEYVRRMAALIAKYNTSCVYYAHASVGELHLRPVLNIKTKEGLEAFKGIAQDTADLVAEFRGSLSGEHGDGRLRGPFVEQMVGTEVFNLFKAVKTTWDPQNLMNPGKIIDTDPIDAFLRVGPETPQPEHQTMFDWSEDLANIGGERVKLQVGRQRSATVPVSAARALGVAPCAPRTWSQRRRKTQPEGEQTRSVARSPKLTPERVLPPTSSKTCLTSVCPARAARRSARRASIWPG